MKMGISDNLPPSEELTTDLFRVDAVCAPQVKLLAYFTIDWRSDSEKAYWRTKLACKVYNEAEDSYQLKTIFLDMVFDRSSDLVVSQCWGGPKNVSIFHPALVECAPFGCGEYVADVLYNYIDNAIVRDNGNLDAILYPSTLAYNIDAPVPVPQVMEDGDDYLDWIVPNNPSSSSNNTPTDTRSDDQLSWKGKFIRFLIRLGLIKDEATIGRRYTL